MLLVTVDLRYIVYTNTNKVQTRIKYKHEKSTHKNKVHTRIKYTHKNKVHTRIKYTHE